MVDQKSGGDSKDLEEAVIDQVEEAMNRLKISPRKVLESLAHLRIQKARIKPLGNETITGGGSADVQCAILAPAAEPADFAQSNDTEYVAVKKLRFNTGTDDDRALVPFAHEVHLLNDLNHSNVVKLVGFVEDVGRRAAWMLFSWEKNGNLREFIRSVNLELPERVFLIYDVAAGLNYLHDRNPPICHGDLKSLNILVNSNNRAVITDFGSARAVDSTTAEMSADVHTTMVTERHDRDTTMESVVERFKAEIAASGEFLTMTGPAWTVRWAAPELLKGNSPGLPSDIWAFGWICWEAMTGNFPFEEENTASVIQRIVTMNLPTIGDNAQLKQIKMLCSLMEECLLLNANRRPLAIRCWQVVSRMDRTIPSPNEGSSLAATRSAGLLFALGRVELVNGVLDEARRYFEQSVEAAKSAGDRHGEARALRGLGDTFSRQGEDSKAGEAFLRARDICSQIGDQFGLARCLDALGHIHHADNDYSKAEESHIQSRDIFSRMGDQRGYANCILSLGNISLNRGDHAKAEELYIQAHDIFSEMDHQTGLARSMRALGDMYFRRDECNRAEELYIRARDICSRIGDKLLFVRSVQRLGNMYRSRGEYSKAEEPYIQARDIYSQLGNQRQSAFYSLRLGDVYHHLKEYSKAEESYIQARDIYTHVGDNRGVAESALGLGYVYYVRGEDSKAEESCIHASSIYSQIGDELEIAESTELLGRILVARGEYAKAEESYLKAQHIYRRVGEMSSLASTLLSMGWLRYYQSRYEEAEHLVLEASARYGRLGLEEDLGQCNDILDEIRRSMNN